MEKIGIFGGSFNPIHKGHIALAEQARIALGLNRVLLIPTSHSPFKQKEEVLDGAARLELCRLAARDFPHITVSDIEVKRGGVSWTFETIDELVRPELELYLIVGGDMYLSIDNWRNSFWIAQTTTVCTAARTEGQLPLLRQKAEQMEGSGYRSIVLDIPVLDISSTELRRMIRAGEDTSAWLAPQVEAEIKAKGYYR